MKTPAGPSPAGTPRDLPLPGMAAIALWMLALAVVGVVGVLTGRYPARTAEISILIFSTLFAIAGLGLVRKRRWGWALTLGASVLFMSFAVYRFFHLRQDQWLLMALVNLVFFLYLVRPQVIQRLR